MQDEFQRLKELGWSLPVVNSLGLFAPLQIDERVISFPSESYNSSETNDEANGFWAIERANSISRILGLEGIETLWEVGAGNGNAAIPLRNMGFNVIPIEPLRSGAITLMKNGFPVFNSTLESLNLPSNSIDSIGAFDVLEHLEKPELLLAEIYRVLKPGGTFICSVPSYPWLFSDFDTSIGHFRRYTVRTLRLLIGKSGLRVTHSEYLFGFLVIPAFILRRIPFLFGRRRNFKSVNKSNRSRFNFLSSLNPLLARIIQLEKLLKIQFGLSIIAVSVKQKS